MSKVLNSFISIVLTVTLVFAFTPIAFADPVTSDQGSIEQGVDDNNNEEEKFPSEGNSNTSSAEENVDTEDKADSDSAEGDNSISSVSGSSSENVNDKSSEKETLVQSDTDQLEDYLDIDALAIKHQSAIPEGNYYIASCLNEVKNLDVAAASKANGAKVQLYQLNMTAAQQWNVSYDSDGYATIKNIASGKVLDVASASTSNGTKVQQYAANDSRAQKWVIVPSGESYIIYSALGSDLVLDVASASTSNGAKVQIYQANGSKAQSWVFDSTEVSYAELDARANASKGLLDDEDIYYIETALASNKVVDISGASKNNGANAQIYDFNKTDAQKYRISYDAAGYVTFTNVNSGKVLDVASASTIPGANVQQYSSNGSRAQKWIVEKNESGSYTISSALWSKLSLDVSGASTANGANVQIYRANGSSAQQWKFVSESELYSSLDKRANDSKGLLDVNDTYYIETSLAKNKVLDIASGSKDNGANAQIYDFNMSVAQQYRVSYDEQGYVTFTNVGSGKVLDVKSGSAESGANVQQYASNDSRAQKWIVEQNNNGTYTISSALWPGLVLDVKSGSSANKANVQIYQSNNSAAQSWNFISENELYASLDKRASINKDVLRDGTYVISSDTDNSKVLDVTNGSKSDGANIQMWEANMSEAQQWKVSHDEKGYVSFTNIGSGKVLEVESGAAQSGTNVQQNSSNDSRGQKWIVEQNEDGTYTLTSAVWDSLVLDIQSGDPKNGSNIQIYTANQTGAQKFDFYDANPVVDPCEKLELGDGYFTIATALPDSSNYVLDVLSGSTSDGANIQMYSSNKSYAQLYSLKFVPDGLFSSTGYYQIICACSDMAVTVNNGCVVDGSNVVQRKANPNDDSQLFAIKLNSDGTYTFVNKASGLALDVANNDVTNGTNLQGYTPNNQMKQRFNISEVKDYLPEGYVTIKSKLKPSMVVDVSNGSLNDGANVQLYSDNGTQAQKWYVSLTEKDSNTYTIQSINSGMNLAVAADGNVIQKAPDGSESQKWQPRISKGYTVLMNVETGKVLDVASAGTSNGTNVQTYAANGSDAQLFTFTSTDLVTKSTYYIKPLGASNMTIDVPSASTANGTNVQIYTKNDTGAQKWKVEKNSDGTYSIKNAQSGKALELSGNEVQINASTNSSAQKWIFTYSRGGGIIITSAADPSMAITVSDGSFALSTSVVGAINENLETQKFTFEKTMYIPSNVPSNFRAMYTKAYSNSSGTDWLILVDRANHLLGVFQGSKENWNLVKALRCTTGKWSTPTPAGVTVSTNKYYYHSQSYWRTVIFNGMYGIHAVISGDWELGKSISNGCIRINKNEAIWLYNTVPLGTTVIVY